MGLFSLRMLCDDMFWLVNRDISKLLSLVMLYLIVFIVVNRYVVGNVVVLMNKYVVLKLFGIYV